MSYEIKFTEMESSELTRFPFQNIDEKNLVTKK